MYRYSNGQISLSDFQQPMGMRLREDNRWVKKAQSIPWDKIEEKYADLFPSETGNVAKPLQLALGACLIQREYGYSDVETVLQIQENPYLQYFCGYAGYDDSKLPFDASSMVHFRKRLTPEVLAQINEMVIQEAQKTEDNDNQDDNKPDGGGNSGTIIVDATCAPSNIRYPQDVSLLNEARENAEKLLDILHSPTDGKKPRTYRKRARKDYLKYVRCRKHTAKMTRKAIGKQLNYLKRDLAAIDGKLNQEKALNIHQTERLETIRKIYEQQKYMYDNHTHSVENRIVSVSQPFVRPIVRGKVGKPVEFGMKLDISVTDGWTRLEYRSFDAYNEATKLQEMIENFHKREGHYPSRVLADKIYRNRENLSYCKARGIRLSGPALGRPKKGEDRNKAQDYRDECERVEVERKFSLGKRKCGMGLVTAKLEETAAHVVALSILLLNLRKIQCAFLQFLDWLLGLLQSREKRMVIQWTLANNNISSRIENSNHIALQALDIRIGNIIVNNHRRTVLRIVEEVQLIVAALHMHNILSMQGMVCYHPIYCLFHPQPVFIIHKLGVGVNALHPRKLPPIFPCVRPLTVIQRGANDTEKATRQCRMTKELQCFNYRLTCCVSSFVMGYATYSHHSPFGSRT